MDYQEIDHFMKISGMASEPAFKDLYILSEEIPQSDKSRILGLYFPEGDNGGKFGYLPPSTTVLPPDVSPGTVLHELGHRYGHFYFDDISEEFAEVYRQEHEEVLMNQINQVIKRPVAHTDICASCSEIIQGRSKTCLYCEYGGYKANRAVHLEVTQGVTARDYRVCSVCGMEEYPQRGIPHYGTGCPRCGSRMTSGLPQSVAATDVTITAIGTVNGNPYAAVYTNFIVKAEVTCRHPDTKTTYLPVAGEVQARLYRHYPLYDTNVSGDISVPAGGKVTIKTVKVDSKNSQFYVYLLHLATNQYLEIKFTCNPDGTYYWGW